MNLHFRKTGEGEPLVILHGLFGSSDNWQSMALKLSEQGFSVFLPDLRNHGRSPHSAIHNYHVMSEDVAEWIAGEIRQPVNLMGHSMGGKVAMQVALTYPQWVKKLMVLDIAPSAYPVLHAEIISALKSINLNSLTSRNEANQLLSEKIRQEDTRQFLLKGLYRDENNNFRWRFNLQALEENIAEIGKEIPGATPFDKPAWFIHGEKSNYVTQEHVPLIKKLFPQAELVMAPASGHWIHADNPGWLENFILSVVK